MKYPTLIIITLFFWCTAFNASAQRKWDDKYYEELTNEDFRSFKLFNNSINIDKIDYKVLNAVLFFVSNEARIGRGLTKADYQPNLEIMAWNHSIAMGEKDFFDHVNSKDKKRKTPKERAELAGITNPTISENISAIGGLKFDSYLALAEHIINGWINSPPHAKNLFSEKALQLGCGAYYYLGVWQGNKDIKKQGDGFWISTQNFQSFSNVVGGQSKDKGPKG